jgi:hypothetical protein
MSDQKVPNRDVTYHLISYDKDGRERQDDPDGIMSDRVAARIRDAAVTDVFVMSHGWKGDIPAAIEQYDRWIGAMLDRTADRQQIRALRPQFTPLLVGFHWPSLPWGDEEFGGDGSFAAAAGDATAHVVPGLDELIETYADRIADTPRARAALRTIFEQAMAAPPVVPVLPPEMADAYRVLDEESQMGSGGPAADPGSDREPFDPNVAYSHAVADADGGVPGLSFGGFGLSSILSPLRQLSFWKMKDRARTIGEAAGFSLLEKLMTAVPQGGDVRFHLMGHSFGCIVVTSMINGRDGQGMLPRTVDSLTLVQGATSLWGYCNDIPNVGGAGHFWPVIERQKVSGPILTTASIHDTAVSRLYPIAAGVARQTAFAPGELPKYGGIGRHGIQGPGIAITDAFIQPETHAYGFQKGHVYNLECSSVINQGGGASGAHSDIDKAEVAHAMWEAVKVL